MTITFSEIQRVAEELHLVADEACLRSAVSRNYYAALHASKAWIATVPGAPSCAGPAGGLHVLIQNQLRGLDPLRATADQRVKGRQLAARLQVLKVRRVKADYHLSEPISRAEIDAQKTETRDYLRSVVQPEPVCTSAT